MSNWVPIDCRFATNLQLSQLKALLPPGVVMQNGFVCVPKNFDNTKLANFHTALWGIHSKLLEGLSSNTAFFQCLLDDQLCEWLNDRHFHDVVFSSGSGNGQITLPGFGTWDVDGSFGAGGDTFNPINQNGFFGGENDDDDDFYSGVICEDNVSGGKTYRISDINPDVTDNVRGFWMKITARRTDC